MKYMNDPQILDLSKKERKRVLKEIRRQEKASTACGCRIAHWHLREDGEIQFALKVPSAYFTWEVPVK